jgi:hypothetical protein
LDFPPFSGVGLTTQVLNARFPSKSEKGMRQKNQIQKSIGVRLTNSTVVELII